MTANNINPKTEIGGASNSVSPSIVDIYVYGFLFPTNYWRTLKELKELYEQKELNNSDMLKLKLLAVLLVEQLLGQGAVKYTRVLELMELYEKFGGKKHE